MELNTPNKNQTISTSLSQFEDSPVFNYINNLSPIELVKSARNDQTFGSLSFSSPPSVFASPKLIAHGDSRSFIKRQHLSDTLKPEVSHIKDDNNTSERMSAKQLECSHSSNLAKEGTAELLDEHLELAVEPPKALKRDRGSPDSHIASLDEIRSDSEPEKADDSNKENHSYQTEKYLRNICCIEQSEDEAGSDWVTLISNVADALNFEPSIIEEHPDEEQKMVDPGIISFISSVLKVPQDNTSSLEDMEHIDCDCVDSSEQKMGEWGTQSIELRNKEADRIPVALSGTLLNKLVVNDAASEEDVGLKRCQTSCKSSIRRLVFEVVGAYRKKSICDSDGASNFPQSDCKVTHVEKLSTSRLSMFSRKGIGLDLNALANASSDSNVVKIEAVSSTRQETDLVTCDSQHRLGETAPQTSVDVNEDFDIGSPTVKRPKFEYVGAACKRCNCKRSKCLKLYCECFAAGLYCIEPCSCQDCFNKPAHEDTVLETRKQIESRNPLAFAPKVIRSTNFVSEFGDETNKTPASARHKRGCNCRKSNCLKKYCECFQGGVGCSPSCRCEGCKNTFGTKNGLEENDLEGGECEVLEKKAPDVTPPDDKIVDEEEHADLTVPSETSRYSSQPLRAANGRLLKSLPGFGSSTQVRTCQKLGIELFRQPKFETHLQVISEEGTPETLTSSYTPSNGVESASPNCKRVSLPHCRFRPSATWSSSRKLILHSVPFPSLDSPNQQ